MEEKEQFSFSKIEIDQTSNEPSIVQVEVNDEAVEDLNKAPLSKEELEKKHKLEDKNDRKSVGKQLVMRHILGVDPEKETTKRQKRFKTFFTVLFVIVIVGVLAWTAYNDFFSESAEKNPPSWAEIMHTLGTNWYFFLFAILSVACCYLFKGLKLSVLCKSMTGKFYFKTCFETGIIGHYYNYVTPLAVGGQPFEIYHLSKHGVHGGVASSMPIAAYFTYQLGFSILAIVSIIGFIPSVNFLQLPPEIIDSGIASALRPMALIGILFGILLPFTVIIFCILPNLGAKLVRLVINIGAKMRIVRNKEKLTEDTIKTVEQNSTCLKNMARQPLVFGLSLILSLLETLSLCSIAYFTLRSFGFDFPSWHIWEWAQIIQVCMILYSAISFIPTPGNSGAADLSFYWLFKISLFAVAGLSFPAMVVWRLLSYYSFVIIGFIFTTAKRKADRKKERQGIPLY